MGKKIRNRLKNKWEWGKKGVPETSSFFQCLVKGNGREREERTREEDSSRSVCLGVAFRVVGDSRLCL